MWACDMVMACDMVIVCGMVIMCGMVVGCNTVVVLGMVVCYVHGTSDGVVHCAPRSWHGMVCGAGMLGVRVAHHVQLHHCSVL